MINQITSNTSYDETNKLVLELVGGNQSDALVWWTSQNDAFNGETPKNIWLKKPEIVHTYLSEIFWGKW
jgi:hypothetical protein